MEKWLKHGFCHFIWYQTDLKELKENIHYYIITKRFGKQCSIAFSSNHKGNMWPFRCIEGYQFWYLQKKKYWVDFKMKSILLWFKQKMGSFSSVRIWSFVLSTVMVPQSLRYQNLWPSNYCGGTIMFDLSISLTHERSVCEKDLSIDQIQKCHRSYIFLNNSSTLTAHLNIFFFFI